jgi:lipoprotein-anchoring transpeptidase ErfK/SrfK
VVFRRELRSASKFGISVLSVGALALVAAACSGTATGTGSGAVAQTRLTITPSSGAKNANPSGGIAIVATGGHLTKVVATVGGHQVAGQLFGGRTLWRSNSALAPSMRYQVVATAVGAGGNRVTKTSSFRTLTPRRTFQATVEIADHQEYGVGMPIILTFSQPITNRGAVEQALSVTTSKPVVGAWYWDGNQTVEFRPAQYWSPGTQVSFTGQLNGVEGANGVYGTHNLHVGFWIGPSLIAKVSTVTHYMDIYYKGRLFGHWAISTGRPGDDTPNGQYLTMGKGNPVLMKGPGYALEVPWSVQFTGNGDFIHDAYWSVGVQGFANVSHGCVNTSPAHAETYYKIEVPGDPVIVTGSPRPPTWDNGWTQWFLPFSQYVQGSALHEAVVAGPKGSTFVSPSSVEPLPTVGPPGHGIT